MIRTISFHIRGLGDWSNVFNLIAKEHVDVALYIDGPYGNPMIDIWGNRFSNFLLIAGGIGITPVRSILRRLIDQAHRGRFIHCLHFAWVCQTKESVDLFPELYQDTNEENVLVARKLFLTKGSKEDVDQINRKKTKLHFECQSEY